MKSPSRAPRVPGRFRRLLWACAVLGALPFAGAQACPQREVEIEQEGLGLVRADSLEYQEDVALLEQACFQVRELTFDARTARATEAGVEAQDLQLSGPSLQGQARRATSQGDTVRLEGLSLSLRLPSLALGALPLPPGEYSLLADQADVLPGGGLRLGDAQLTNQASGEQYRLVGALLQGERLSASRAELVRLEAQSLQGQPNRVSAGPSELGLCRDPRSRELALRSESFVATPAGSVLTAARLQLFGVPLPAFGTLTLPVTAQGDTLGETLGSLAQGAQALSERVGRAAPELVLGQGRFGVRALPFFDEAESRLNVVMHPRYLEFGVRTSIDGADLALGIFQDPDTEGQPASLDRPLPQFVLTRRPPEGQQLTLAFRGGDELSETRFGGSWRFPLVQGALSASGRLLLEAGLGHQLGLSDVFGRADAELTASWRGGAFGADLRAGLDGYAFLSGSQVRAETALRFDLTQGAITLSAEQFERQVWGGALLPALRVSAARTTSAELGWTPHLSVRGVDLRAVNYAARYDWHSQHFVQNQLGATFATRALDTEVVPTLSYDWASQRLGLHTEVTRFSECFAYGLSVDAYRFPDRSGVSARLKLSLR